MIFDNLNDFLLRLVKAVGGISSEHGVRSFLVGGCVRDLILQRKVLDLDFAVENDAFFIARDFAKRFGGQVVFYRQFLTATVTLPDGKRIDFSTLRRETYPYPGALPVVQKGSLRDDLFRRDFSINAIAVGVNPDAFAKVFDEFAGMKAMDKKKICVLHEQSFMDDPTRILRAVRFEQRLGFKLESHTEELLKRALKENAVANVKSPRLFEEFKKNLKEPLALRNLIRLSKLGLFKKAGWGFRLSNRQCNALRSLDRVDVTKNLEYVPKIDVWLIRLMILLSGFSRAGIEKLMAVLALSSLDRAKVLSAKELLRVFRGQGSSSYSQEKAFHLLQTKSHEEILFVWASDARPAVRSLMRKALTKWRNVELKISGDDLKREGVPVGKVYKRLLADVLYRVAQGGCQSREEQLEYVRKLFR